RRRVPRRHKAAERRSLPLISSEGRRRRRVPRRHKAAERRSLPLIFCFMELEVVEGDIATLEVDAITNAANDRLWMGAGVAGAIKRAGGEEIEREAVAKGPIAIGDAVATGAGKLPAKHVIHAAVMGQDLVTSAGAIRTATRRTLEVAEELGAVSVALPAFGTGVGGFPLGECARLMVQEARAFEPRSLQRVVFAVYGDEARRVFE